MSPTFTWKCESIDHASGSRSQEFVSTICPNKFGTNRDDFAAQTISLGQCENRSPWFRCCRRACMPSDHSVSATAIHIATTPGVWVSSTRDHRHQQREA